MLIFDTGTTDGQLLYHCNEFSFHYLEDMSFSSDWYEMLLILLGRTNGATSTYMGSAIITTLSFIVTYTSFEVDENITLPEG